MTQTKRAYGEVYDARNTLSLVAFDSGQAIVADGRRTAGQGESVQNTHSSRGLFAAVGHTPSCEG